NLGLGLAMQGKLDEAISHYSEALRINPGFRKAHRELQLALGKGGLD
ncbi:MAG: tetratricopeptide repeat protein, partial [Proteobacteria bacterium]|nr:tetratricopeptide repeat protein [Pseudomonadota bacterium]